MFLPNSGPSRSLGFPEISRFIHGARRMNFIHCPGNLSMERLKKFSLQKFLEISSKLGACLRFRVFLYHQPISELIVTIGKSTAYISREFSYYKHSFEEGHRALIWPKAQEVLIMSLGRLPGKIF